MRSMAQNRLTAVGRVAAEGLANLVKLTGGVGLLHAQRDAHGGRNADGGRATDHHGRMASAICR